MLTASDAPGRGELASLEAAVDELRTLDWDSVATGSTPLAGKPLFHDPQQLEHRADQVIQEMHRLRTALAQTSATLQDEQRQRAEEAQRHREALVAGQREIQQVRAGAAAAVAAIEKDLLVARAAAEKARRAAAVDPLAAHAAPPPTTTAATVEAPEEQAAPAVPAVASVEAAVPAPDTLRPELVEAERAELEQLRARVESLEAQLATVRWQSVTTSEEQQMEVRICLLLLPLLHRCYICYTLWLHCGRSSVSSGSWPTPPVKDPPRPPR